jgi:hypothetical protein
MKSMILLAIMINPWPPKDFGFLVDSQTFSTDFGIAKEGFSIMCSAIFGIGPRNNSYFDNKVHIYHNCIRFPYFLSSIDFNILLLSRKINTPIHFSGDCQSCLFLEKTFPWSKI